MVAQPIGRVYTVFGFAPHDLPNQQHVECPHIAINPLLTNHGLPSDDFPQKDGIA